LLVAVAVALQGLHRVTLLAVAVVLGAIVRLFLGNLLAAVVVLSRNLW
jgi:hypothetical protein